MWMCIVIIFFMMRYAFLGQSRVVWLSQLSQNQRPSIPSSSSSSGTLFGSAFGLICTLLYISKSLLCWSSCSAVEIESGVSGCETDLEPPSSMFLGRCVFVGLSNLVTGVIGALFARSESIAIRPTIRPIEKISQPITFRTVSQLKEKSYLNGLNGH